MNFVSKFDGVLPLTGNHPKAQLHVDTVSTKAPVDAIIVQDAQLLFTGDFKRSGSDLVISKGDHELRLEDYFKGDKHAPLASPDGAYLTGGIVDALVGHVQMAQADGSASAAKIIGHVTKLTGNATVVRNGVSIILNNGDNVHQGDVVQSGSNSTLGITFIDGSVFGLASNAKMVLNEMVYDPNGSTNTSLMSLVAGTITFVAGATAKHGDMKVDTPVATMGIRGTACVVEIEFDLLSVQPNPLGPQLAPPVKFQVLVEPDGTSGSYVLLDRTTLAPIATVNQPGTVTTVSGTGAVSFLASAQLSPELMKLITDVFSQKFTDNANPKSDTHFTDIGVLQNSFGFKTTFVDPSIGVVQVVIAQGSAPSAPPPPPGTLDHIPGPPDVFAESKAFAEKLQLTGSSLIDSATGKINYSDINAGDTPSARTEFGKFSYKDANGNDVTATLTAAQLAAIKSAEVPLVVVQDPSHLNHGAATWTYNIKDGALDFLAEGETLTLTYRALVDNNFAPANETGYFDFTITITGTNDAPTIVANLTNATGGVVEDSNVNASGNITADGIITFNDVDLTDVHAASFVLKSSHATASLPGFADGASVGTFKLTPISETPADADTVGSFGWNFTLDDANPILQSLAEGQTITLVYTVTVSDGHGGTVSQDVTITVTGSNDSPNHAPTIVGELTVATGDVTEDVNPNASNELAAAGTITFRDVDLIDTHTATFVPLSSSTSTPLPGFTNGTSYFGTFELTAVNEDNTDTINTGSVGWTFTIDNALAQQLAVGQVVTEVYRVTISDNHGASVEQDVTVTITGTEDAPTIVADSTTASGGVVEDGQQTASGTITFQDVDLIDTHVVGQTLKGGTASVALPGFNPATQQFGTLSLTLHENVTDTDNLGTVDWKFTIDNALAQQLAVGQDITQTYTVSIDDQHGGVITQDVTVTITGTEDAPTIVADSTTASGGVVEDGQQTASGTITFQDVDLIDSHVIGQTLKGGSASVALPGFNPATQPFGTLSLTLHENVTDTDNLGTVDWKFTIDNALAQQLAVGQDITQTFTVSIDDQHGGVITQDVTVTITGTEDAPTIVAGSTTASGAVVEDGQQTASGTITFQDVDLIDTHVIGQTLKGGSASVALPGFNPATQQLGTLSLTLHENTGDTDNLGTVDWKFTIDNALAQQLAVGQIITQIYTVSIDDQHGGVITQDITVTITGTEDGPTIVTNRAPAIVSSLTTIPGLVVEDGQQTTSGTITFQDVDLIDTHVVGQTLKGGSASVALPGFNPATQQLGTLALTLHEDPTDANNFGTVDWKFTLDNAMAQRLAVGQVITQTYTVSIDDQHGGVITQDVTVTIVGTEDAPTIVSGLTTAWGGVVEDVEQCAFGTITFQDVDLIDTHVISQTLKGGSASVALPGFNPATQQLGTLELTLHENTGDTSNLGTVDWKFTLNNALAQQLAAGQVITQTYTVSIDDQHGGVITQDVTVLIAGTNDAPVITSAAQGATIEVHDDGGPPHPYDTASGKITFTDVDLIDVHTVKVVGLTTSGTTYGLPSKDTMLSWLTLGTFNDSTNGATGSRTWSFSAPDSRFHYLDEGQHVTLTYTILVSDGHGGFDTQQVAVTITDYDGVQPVMSIATAAPSSAPSVLGVSNDQVLGIHDTETIGPNDTPPASPAVNSGLAGVEKIGGTPEGNPQHLGAFDVVTTDRGFSHTADQARGLGDHDTFLPTNPPPAGPAVNAGLAVTHDFGATPTHADAPVPDNFLTGHADQFVFRTGGLMGSGKSADFAPGDVHVDLPALFQHTDDSVTAWLGSHAAASPGGGADLPIAPGNVGTAAHVNPAVSNPEADHFIHSQHIVV